MHEIYHSGTTALAFVASGPSDFPYAAGPLDVSVNAICQLAGVSKPSLYRVFDNEDGLTLAALDRYAEQVLSDIFEILQTSCDLDSTLDELIEFASRDPRMETGCLFYKMRAGKHRLGPKTRARVEEIAAAAQSGYIDFLKARRNAGDWPGILSVYLLKRVRNTLANR